MDLQDILPEEVREQSVILTVLTATNTLSLACPQQNHQPRT
jgi:hypothetical protein